MIKSYDGYFLTHCVFQKKFYIMLLKKGLNIFKIWIALVIKRLKTIRLGTYNQEFRENSFS